MVHIVEMYNRGFYSYICISSIPGLRNLIRPLSLGRNYLTNSYNNTYICLLCGRRERFVHFTLRLYSSISSYLQRLIAALWPPSHNTLPCCCLPPPLRQCVPHIPLSVQPPPYPKYMCNFLSKWNTKQNRIDSKRMYMCEIFLCHL